MEPYIGEIKMFGGTFAPRGWLLCDGAAYNPNNSSYANLHAVIMENFGGDGHSYFNVPDLRGRAPVQWGKGDGLSPYSIGQKAGNETVSLTVPQLPAHNHAVNAITEGNQVVPATFYPAAVPLDPTTGAGSKNWASGNANAVLNAGTIGATGSNQPVNIVSPVLVVTYIIAYEGIFPPRP